MVIYCYKNYPVQFMKLAETCAQIARNKRILKTAAVIRRQWDIMTNTCL
jgi:hypothetical protein